MNVIGMIVCFTLFGLMSVVHLYFCFKEDEQKRKITKPFLLVLLGLGLVFYVPQYPLIPSACFLSALGDLVLIWNKKRPLFALGALFFGLNHILNMITQINVLVQNPTPTLYIYIAIAVAVIALLGLLMQSGDWMGLVTFGFSALHIVNIILALLAMAMGYYLAGGIILLGYIFCVSSDILLAQATFKKDFKRRDFYIMLTYLVGQAIIYTGLSFLAQM